MRESEMARAGTDGFFFQSKLRSSDKIVTLASASSPYPRFNDVRSVRLGAMLVAHAVSAARPSAGRLARRWRPPPALPSRRIARFPRAPRSVSERWVRTDFDDEEDLAKSTIPGPGEKRGQTKKQKLQEAERLGMTLDEYDPPSSAAGAGAEDEDEHSKEDRDFALKRLAFLVACIFLALVLGISAMLNPSILHPLARTTLVIGSLAERLLVGGSGKDYSLEATVCLAAVLALRLLLEPVGRRLYRWWTGKRSEKSWQDSLMHWLILKVYGPVEVALVATAAVRYFEAIVQRAGIGAAGIVSSVVEKVVQGAMVLAFSRVLLSWQERLAELKAEELKASGQTLQAERLSGIVKLSSVATYALALVLGLKVLGVDVGALVTVGGISGLAIGLAGRQILENAFMGLMLYVTSPFTPGDEIKFSTSAEKNVQGFVLDIGLFRTTIRSLHREVYSVPNSLFSTIVVLNITRRGKTYRVKHEVMVRLDDAPRVSNLLSNYRSVIKSDPRVVRSMHRRVFLQKVSNDGLHVMISFFVEAVNKDQFYAIQQDLLQAFLETCQKNGVRVSPPLLLTVNTPAETAGGEESKGSDGEKNADAAALGKGEESKKRSSDREEKEDRSEKVGGLKAGLSALAKVTDRTERAKE